MKSKILFTVLTALALGMNAGIADDDTPLSKEMSALNKSLRALKRQAGDASMKTQNLELIAKMKANVAAGLKYEPAKTKEQPVADKPTYVDKYKAQMKDLDAALDEAKAAIEKGDADAQQKAFDKLSDLKEKGHKDFAPDE
jgi:soluble cytochrome b562